MIQEIELPNGQIMYDIPADATKEEVKRKAIAMGMATEADFQTGQPPPEPAPMPEQQAQPERKPLNIIPDMPPRGEIVAGQQNGFEEILRGGQKALELGVGGLDLGYSIGRNIAADAVAMVQQVGNGLFKMTRTGNANELKVEDAELLRKVEQTRSLLGSEPYSEEGRALQKQIAESISEELEGTSVGNGLAVISQGIDSAKEWLNKRTGSQVYTDALLSGGALALEYLTAGTASKGYTIGKSATLFDVRKTALALDPAVFNVDKIRDLRNLAYEELGAVDVRQGTYNRAVNFALNDLPAEDAAVITSFIEQQLKRQRSTAAAREAKFGPTYNERVSDVTDLQREMLKRAEGVDDTKEAYILKTAARNLDRFLFDDDNVGFLKFGYEDMTPEQVKALRGDAQRMSGQIIRHNQMKDIMELAADSYAGGTDGKGKVGNFSKYMSEFLQDKSKSKFYSDYERALMQEIADEVPLSNDGEIITPYVRLFGSASKSADGPAVFAAKTARAISPTMRQIALVQPARYIENLISRKKTKFGKAYESLTAQVLAGQRKGVNAMGDATKDGETMILRYLKAVPPAKRDFKELGEILAMHSTDLQDIKLDELKSKVQRDAVAYARGLQVISAGLTQEAIQNGVLEEGTLPDFMRGKQKKPKENKPKRRDYVGDYERLERTMR